jgi:hypothetical protein
VAGLYLLAHLGDERRDPPAPALVDRINAGCLALSEATRTGTRSATDATSTPWPGCQPDVVASAHGPVLTGEAIPDAFDRVRALAGEPRTMTCSWAS